MRVRTHDGVAPAATIDARACAHLDPVADAVGLAVEEEDKIRSAVEEGRRDHGLNPVDALSKVHGRTHITLCGLLEAGCAHYCNHTHQHAIQQHDIAALTTQH